MVPGGMVLAGHLARAGHILAGAFDLPDDTRSARYDISDGASFVTNPPYWGRPNVHLLIVNLSDQADAWLLMPGDWIFNRSSAALCRDCARSSPSDG
jgi:hypothetical protein